MADPGDIVNIPFAGTLNEKLDPKLTDRGQLLVLQNLYQSRTGELVKRKGFDKTSQLIQGGGSIGNQAIDGPVHELEGSLNVHSNGKLYSFLQGEDTWREIDSRTQFKIKTTQYRGNALQAIGGGRRINQFVDTTNNVLLIAYTVSQDVGGAALVYIDALDLATGAILDTFHPATTDIVGQTKFVDLPGASRIGIIVTRAGVGDSSLYYSYFDTATKQFVVVGNVGTQIHNNGGSFQFEVMPIGTSDFIVGFQDFNSNFVEFRSYDSTGAFGSSYQDLINNGLFYISGNVVSSGVVFFYLDEQNPGGPSAIKGIRFTDASLTIGSGPTVIVTVGANDAIHCIASVTVSSSLTDVYWTDLDTTSTPLNPPYLAGSGSTTRTPFRRLNYVSVSHGSFTTSGQAEIQRMVGIEAYPFYDSSAGKSFILVSYQDEEESFLGVQSSRFLVDRDGRVCAVLDVGECFGLGRLYFDSFLTGGDVLPATFANGSEYWMPVNRIVSIKITTTSPTRREYFAEYHIHKFDPVTSFGERAADPKIESSEVVIQSGGYVSLFDNEAERPLNVEIWPSASEFGIQAGPSSLTVGDYGAAVVYEFFDAKGNRHQSAAAFSDTITNPGGANQIVVTVPTLRFGNLPLEEVNIAVYRTVVGGSIYYRDNVKLNDPTVDTVTILLTRADADVEDEEVLYQTVELPNAQPPSALHMVENEDKVYLIPAANRRTIWESKPVSSGRPLEFSQGLLIDFPGKGDIVGMAVDNGRKIVFKEDSIWYFTGRGRDATGQGQFSEIRHLTDEAGAIYTNSIKSTTMGTVFQSRRGIYLLGSDLQLNYIGAAVESTMEGSRVTDVVERHGLQQIWFAMQTPQGAALVLVWDYFHNAWSKYIVVGTSIFGFLQTRDSFFTVADWLREEQDDYFDESFTVQALVQSPWIKTGAIQEEGRAFELGILGQLKDDHTLRVRLFKDYDDLNPFSTFLAASSDFADPYLLRAKVNEPSCMAIMVELIDFFPQNTGDSLSLTDLSVVLYREQGVRRLADSQQR